ncbi:hypothetical protein [Bacteroides sp.]|uniref:hypothetical protein n=1 Tax=Bacteroides sp. TaxID=29523 RepID=UPI0026269A56|nr:hypothetical protein [Bacteroides sp.]MDD3039596.1 hypothetical protein [Bacteroides sp.]
MHLPFIIDDEGLIVEGQHRLKALKLVNDQNKYLAIHANLCKYRGIDVKAMRITPITLRVPDKSISGIYLLNVKIERIDSEWLNLTFTDTRTLIYSFISFGIWLRNPIFAWESVNGTIRGHEIINERFK